MSTHYYTHKHKDTPTQIRLNECRKALRERQRETERGREGEVRAQRSAASQDLDSCDTAKSEPNAFICPHHTAHTQIIMTDFLVANRYERG